MGLSHWLAREKFEHFVLVTDREGKEQAEAMGFAYDDILTDLDDLDVSVPINVWSAGKFPAIQRATSLADTFCHLDFDVFLFQPLPAEFMRSGIFAQTLETEEGRNLNRHMAYRIGDIQLPVAHQPWILAHRLGSIEAVNMGIFGGTDISFWRRYAAMALSMLRMYENRFAWAAAEGDVASLLIEQWFICALARYDGKRIETLLPDNEPEELAVSLGYAHFLCWSKKNPYWARRIEKTLFDLYPEEHKRLSRLSEQSALPVAKPHSL